MGGRLVISNYAN